MNTFVERIISMLSLLSQESRESSTTIGKYEMPEERKMDI